MSADHQRKRIFMLGLRGIPDVQGGVEKHVEELSRRLPLKGYDVTVMGRCHYLKHREPYYWQDVKIISLYAPRSRYFEAIVNSFFGVLYAAKHKADIVHIHAIGPSLMAPLARALGLKVVITHHGFDYDRQKWGAVARKVLKLGEYLGMKFSHARIAVSRHIADVMQKRYHVDVTYIPNGVAIFEGTPDENLLDQFQLSPANYLINVARIVPEKRQLDLIEAYEKLNRPGVPLVLVGGGNDHCDYYAQVQARAAEVAGVVMTGVLTGEKLAAIFAHASLFILPSSHEGMPIALLEALHYDVPVLASDIIANVEVGMPPENYFPLGDIAALTTAMNKKLSSASKSDKELDNFLYLKQDFSWDHIADQTCAVYAQVLQGASK